MSVGSVLVALVLVVFGYLVGSLSPSVLLGRRFRGVDVRRQGSGNAGTTNAFRVLGWRLGLAVLFADLLKGIVPVLLARYLSDPLVTVFVAFACVAGHNYSVFLRGKGGKGVATGAGAAIAMMPVPMAILIVVIVAGLVTLWFVIRQVDIPRFELAAWGEVLSSGMAHIIVIIGVLRMRTSRLAAFRTFRSALLILIFLRM